MLPKAVIFSCGNYALSASVQAFITCQLDCCNSLLVGLMACDVSHLQSVQNAAGRLFGCVSRNDSVEHVLGDKLHGLPIVQRINFKVGVFGYKAINGLAAPQLKDLFVTVSSISASSRNRSAVHGDFMIPSVTKNITYRRQSFTVAEPTLWNSHPLEIRSSSSLPMFRSRLKTFLFREAYNISVS